MLNFQGMNPSADSTSSYKLTELVEEHIHKANMPKQSIPFIIISETWLKPFISNAQIAIPDYEIARQDRINRDCGGVLLYVHNTLPISDTLCYDDGTCEAVVCSVKSIKTKIASIYRPPNADAKSFENLLRFLDDALTDKNDPGRFNDIIIAGDFNLPNIDWKVSHIHSENKLSSSCENQLLCFMENHFLSQYVTEPTRGKNILDLFLTNNANLVLYSTAEDYKPMSDHNLVKVHTTYNMQLSSVNKKLHIPDGTFRSLDLHRADYEKINSHLDTIQWDQLKELCSLEEFPELLRLTILQVCMLYTPAKKYPSKRQQMNPYFRERQILRRRKQKVKNQIKMKKRLNPTAKKIIQLRAELYDINMKIRDSIEKQGLSKENLVVKKVKENPRYFYSYAKRFCKQQSTVGPLLNNQNELENDPQKMADLLQHQYSSVFSNPNSPDKEIPNLDLLIENSISNIKFNEKDIIKAIDEIKSDSACGEDDIPAIILKNCKRNLSYPILKLWQDSFEQGYIPKQYKKQIITPIHKKDSKADPANYRPIALTSHIIKIFGRIIRNHLIAHLENNSLLCNNQHGFRPHRSCLTQLLPHIDMILLNLLEGQDTDVIYLDFAKAFDKVDHEILLKKLHAYGIRGKLLTWLTCYLADRQQTVVINGKHSYPADVISGVPQGTVLGPILFIIYLNDMQKCITNSVISSFADDTRLKRSINTTSDKQLLQNDLTKSIKWSIANNMVLHQKKFELLCHSINRHNHLKHLPFYTEYTEYHTEDGSIISPQCSVKDLGVTITPDISWSPHISKVTEAARKTSSWILSVFADRRAEIMLPLYYTLVRSRAEYCSPLWHPSKIEDIKQIESIQKMFTSQIKEVQHLPYWDRLKHLNLMSLQRRRERYCILHVFKILHQLTPNDLNFQFCYSKRRGLCCIIPPINKLSSMKAQSKYDNSFRVLGAKLWNCIPPHIRQKSTLTSFKSALTKFLLTLEDHPPVSGIVSQNSLIDVLATGYNTQGYVEEEDGQGEGAQMVIS